MSVEQEITYHWNGVDLVDFVQQLWYSVDLSTPMETVMLDAFVMVIDW